MKWLCTGKMYARTTLLPVKKKKAIWDYHESRSINISTTFNHHSGCKGSCFDTHIHHAPWWFKISTARIPREKVGSMFLLKANLLQVCNSKKLDEHPPPFLVFWRATDGFLIIFSQAATPLKLNVVTWKWAPMWQTPCIAERKILFHKHSFWRGNHFRTLGGRSSML